MTTLFVVAVAMMAIGGGVLPVFWQKVLASHVAALLVIAGIAVGLSTGTIVWTWFDAALFALVLSMTVSTLTARVPLRSFLPRQRRGDGLATSICYALVAFGAAHVTGSERLWLLTAFVVVGAAISALALLQSWGVRWATAWGCMGMFSFRYRGFGTILNPVFFGGYIVLLVPIAFVLALATPWMLLPMMLVVIGLIVSGTRAAWGGAFLVVPFLSAFAWHADLGPSVAFMGIAAVFAATAASHVDGELGLIHPASMTGRAFPWGYCFARMWARPAFGWGQNTIMQPELDNSTVFENAHNEFLEVANNHGMIGLGLYLTVIAMAFVGAVYGAPILALSIVAYLVYAQFGWSHVGPANLWWVILGLAGGLYGA